MSHAVAASGWSLSGSILTFAFPMGLFIVAAAALFLVFSRPHRVPGHGPLAPARSGPPGTGTAQATAVAAGLHTAAGGGAAPLAHEAQGVPGAAAAAEAAETTGTARPADDQGTAGSTGTAGTPGSTGTTGYSGTGQGGTTGAAGDTGTAPAEAGPEAGE